MIFLVLKVPSFQQVGNCMLEQISCRDRRQEPLMGHFTCRGFRAPDRPRWDPEPQNPAASPSAVKETHTRVRETRAVACFLMDANKEAGGVFYPFWN